MVRHEQCAVAGNGQFEGSVITREERRGQTPAIQLGRSRSRTRRTPTALFPDPKRQPKPVESRPTSVELQQKGCNRHGVWAGPSLPSLESGSSQGFSAGYRSGRVDLLPLSPCPNQLKKSYTYTADMAFVDCLCVNEAERGGLRRVASLGSSVKAKVFGSLRFCCSRDDFEPSCRQQTQRTPFKRNPASSIQSSVAHYTNQQA